MLSHLESAAAVLVWRWTTGGGDDDGGCSVWVCRAAPTTATPLSGFVGGAGNRSQLWRVGNCGWCPITSAAFLGSRNRVMGGASAGANRQGPQKFCWRETSLTPPYCVLCSLARPSTTSPPPASAAHRQRQIPSMPAPTALQRAPEALAQEPAPMAVGNTTPDRPS